MALKTPTPKLSNIWAAVLPASVAPTVLEMVFRERMAAMGRSMFLWSFWKSYMRFLMLTKLEVHTEKITSGLWHQTYNKTHLSIWARWTATALQIKKHITRQTWNLVRGEVLEQLEDRIMEPLDAN